jgi:predicted lipoprotein
MDRGAAKTPDLLVPAILLAVAATLLVLFPPFHVVPLDEARVRSTQQEFDGDAFVDKIWGKLSAPDTDSVVDAAGLLGALAEDPAAAARRYGHRLGLSGRASYFVSGSGTITAVDGRNVEIVLSGGGSVVIGTGPVFGNAVRDGSGLFDVNEFANSQDFNAVSAEINRRVEELVLPTLREEAAVGRALRFVGGVEVADSEPAGGPLKLIPVSIEFP